MALFNATTFASAPRTLVSREPLRGQVGESTSTWENTIGDVVLKNSYTAEFFQTGTVTTWVFTGLDEAGANALADSLTKQDQIAHASGLYGTGMFYVKRAKRASVRHVAGRMYEVSYVEESRTVAEYTGTVE